jgi:dTMP kinase
MRFTRRFDGLRALFQRKDFRRLCVSQLWGGLGEWVATLALIALVWERTHSAFVSGLVLALRIVPAALVSGFLGSLVDKLDRKVVLVACTAGRALIYASLPFIGGIAPVLGLALVAELASVAYIAARDATIPRLVSDEHLPTANAISLASSFGTMPFGALLYGAFHWLQARFISRGEDLGLIGAGAMLAAATVMLRHLNAALASSRAEVAPRAPGEPKIKLGDVLRADPVLKRVVVTGVIAACSAGSLITLGLSYVRDTLHAGPAAYGALLTAFGFGAAAGVGAVQKMRARLPKLFHMGVATMGAILVVMAAIPSKAMGLGMAFGFGAAFIATFLGGITIIQTRVDDAVRGRAFAMAHSTLRVGAVAVGLLAAWGAKALGTHAFASFDGNQVMLGASGIGLVLAGAAPRGRRRAASAETAVPVAAA